MIKTAQVVTITTKPYFLLDFKVAFRMVNNFSIKPNTISVINASIAINKLPVKVIAVLLVVIPRYIATPKPPAPIKEAIPANAIVIVTIFLKPDIITGSANGNLILYKICQRVDPTPVAASIILSSILIIPVYVFLTIGNNA